MADAPSTHQSVVVPEPQTVSPQTGGGKVFSPAPPPSATRPQGSSPSRQRTLKTRSKVAIQAYCTPNTPTFLNRKQAYKVSHPNAGDRTAEVEGSKLMMKPEAVAIIQDELEALGWSKERLERELAWNVNQCKDKGKLNDHREAIMSLAKLRGDLVDKSEVKQVDEHQKDAIRRLVSESLRAPN